MIRDDFYRNGEETLTSGIVVSKWIPDLYTDGELKTDIADAYALGYIPYDEAPQTLIDLHAISFSNNLTTINFSTIEENRAWGYCWQNATGSDTRFNGQAYGYENDNSLFTLSSSTTNKVRFTNDIQYSQVIQVDVIDFQVETFCFLTSSIDSNGNAHNGSTNQGHMTTDYTMFRQEYLDFLNGEATISQVRYHTPADNTTLYTTLSYSDFDEEKGIAKQIIGDYTLYIIFNEVGHSLSGARYSYKNDQNVWTEGNVNLTPFFISSVDSSVGFTPQKIMYMPLGWTSIGGQPRFTLQNSKENFGPTYTSGSTAHCIKQACTSWYGLSSVNLADFSKTSGMHYEMLRESAFIYFNAGDGNTFVFIPIVRPKDIYKIFTLINSVNAGIGTQAQLDNLDPPNYSYEQSVALFDENNTPLYRVEQGDTAQAADPAILQPWQMPGAHNYDNDFDTDDIPGYEPESGDDPVGPPNGGIHGDAVPSDAYNLPNQNFINYGVFNSDALSVLTNQLWAKPTGFFDSLTASQKVNPMNYFVSLRAYPIPHLRKNATLGEVKTTLELGRGGEISDAAMTYRELNTQGVSYVFGELTVEPYYNNFLDYPPYTKVYVSLPYCGQFELNASVIMGKTLIAKAIIDLSNGSINWEIRVKKDQYNHYVILNKQGKIGADIPLTSIDASQMGANIVNASMRVAGHVLNAGDALKSSGTNLAEGIYTGDMGAVGSGLKTLGGLGLQALGDSYAMGMASKEIVDKLQASSGICALMTGLNTHPILIYQRPIQKNPSSYGKTIGYLVNKEAEIKDVSGFTICKNPQLNIKNATDKELQEIKNLLESGFYA